VFATKPFHMLLVASSPSHEAAILELPNNDAGLLPSAETTERISSK